MTSAYITKRETTRSGTRWIVRYRLGGRYTKLQHAGSFKTNREARMRLDLVRGEIAAGRDPRTILDALKQPTVAAGLRRSYDEFILSRVDVGASAQQQYRLSRDKFCGLLGDTVDPATVTAADVQEAISDIGLAPNTVRAYVSVLAQVLDFADVDPNPVRSNKFRLPVVEQEEVSPPSTVEWQAIRAKLSRKYLLPLTIVEALGMRAGEVCSLTYGDIDFTEARFRVSVTRAKTRAGQRWLPVPRELLDQISDLCPLEDRSKDRRVFPDMTISTIHHGLDRACINAGVAHYHPHDLRHRRISLWFAHGFDQVTIKTWAGHRRASMSSDVYGHVVVSADDEWREFWQDAYSSARAPRPLLPGEVTKGQA